MEPDPLRLELIQPQLFAFGETSEAALELFPTVWGACEELVAQEISVRSRGLETLLALDAARYSPLVAYMLATRLSDPDLELRRRVIIELASLLVFDQLGTAAPENVRHMLQATLRNLARNDILGLLEAGASDPDIEISLATLFNVMPEAGSLLAAILADRTAALDLRNMAVRMIRQVGYLDTLNDLERLASRLESRIKGQQEMPFAPPVVLDEQGLLAEIRATLLTLREP